jgi:hypothetical protein
LWALPSLQANLGFDQPSLRALPLQRAPLVPYQGVDWHSRVKSKSLARSSHQALVELDGASPNLKAMASLALLISSKIWNERNAIVFRNKHASPSVILENIKREARLWVLAGAKRLGELIPGE